MSDAAENARDLADRMRERGEDENAEFVDYMADAMESLERNFPDRHDRVIPEGVYLCLQCGGFKSDESCPHSLEERKQEPTLSRGGDT